MKNKMLKPTIRVLLCMALAVVGYLVWVLPARAQAVPARSATSALSAPQAVPPAVDCAALAAFDLTGIGGAGSGVTAAVAGDMPGTAPGTVAAGCIVDGVLAPAIRFRVALPLRGWTQRYLQVGCGGLCGRVSLEVGAADGCMPLQAGGFVLASTDMGHSGNGGEFGRDAQQRADFAHRGVHLTALTAKQLIKRFYGRGPAFSYFSGCSDGGREALVEAQRYPEDFDGVIAGAPALNFQVQNGLYHAWQARANTGADGKPVLLAGRLPLLHAAVLKQCDALDGARDGLVSDPLNCRFDPAVLACPAGAAGADCLSAAEVQTVRRLYDGPRDADTGERLTVGGPMPGSELAWAGVFVPGDAAQPIFSERIAMDALRHLSFEKPPPDNFSLADLRFDRATFDRLRPRHPLFDTTNPDLSAFAARGGKLILWHGWADPHISPANTLAYHQAVGAVMGEQRRQAFERLYLLPGVHHCAGGEGPSAIDLLTPMLAWVEQGTAPQAIVARPASESAEHNGFGQPGGMPPRPGGAMPPGPPPLPALPTQRTRPASATVPREIQPYPAGAAAARLPEWAGADLFRPYEPREK